MCLRSKKKLFLRDFFGSRNLRIFHAGILSVEKHQGPWGARIHTGLMGADGHTDLTDEPHNHPNPPERTLSLRRGRLNSSTPQNAGIGSKTPGGAGTPRTCAGTGTR